MAKLSKVMLEQAVSCEDLGSPFTAKLLRVISDHLTTDGPIWSRLASWNGDIGPNGDSVPLRVVGALHGLVIEGKSRELSDIYPPNSVNLSDKELWEIISTAVHNHADFINDRLDRAPQTNEVRRSSAILLGAMKIAELTGKSNLVMSEVGASAGLNMFWDKFGYDLPGQHWGDDQAAVQVSPEWSGTNPQMAEISVLERAACDLNPVNIRDETELKRLMSYIWPDQLDRMARTRHAMEIFLSEGWQVEQADAIDWLKERLANSYEGAAHIIYHTVVWQYFPEPLKAAGEALLEDAGIRATKEAPLARLSMEADGNPKGASLKVTVWPGQITTEIARVDFHGRWIEVL